MEQALTGQADAVQLAQIFLYLQMKVSIVPIQYCILYGLNMFNRWWNCLRYRFGSWPIECVTLDMEYHVRPSASSILGRVWEDSHRTRRIQSRPSQQSKIAKTNHRNPINSTIQPNAPASYFVAAIAAVPAVAAVMNGGINLPRLEPIRTNQHPMPPDYRMIENRASRYRPMSPHPAESHRNASVWNKQQYDSLNEMSRDECIAENGTWWEKRCSRRT